MASTSDAAPKSISVSGGGVKRKSTCPFGEGYYLKLARLLLSEEPQAIGELMQCVQLVASSKQARSDELWDSGDEMSTSDSSSRAPMQKKFGLERSRPIIKQIDSLPDKKKLFNK